MKNLAQSEETSKVKHVTQNHTFQIKRRKPERKNQLRKVMDSKSPKFLQDNIWKEKNRKMHHWEFPTYWLWDAWTGMNLCFVTTRVNHWCVNCNCVWMWMIWSGRPSLTTSKLCLKGASCILVILYFGIYHVKCPHRLTDIAEMGVLRNHACLYNIRKCSICQSWCTIGFAEMSLEGGVEETGCEVICAI